MHTATVLCSDFKLDEIERGDKSQVVDGSPVSINRRIRCDMNGQVCGLLRDSVLSGSRSAGSCSPCLSDSCPLSTVLRDRGLQPLPLPLPLMLRKQEFQAPFLQTIAM